MIYVDPLKKYKSGYWCHMVSDAGLAELHDFAHRLGLHRRYFHNTKHPHYDLRPAYRQKAVAAGAQEVSSKEMILKLRGTHGPPETGFDTQQSC